MNKQAIIFLLYFATSFVFGSQSQASRSCVSAVESRAVLLPEDIWRSLSPRSLSVWMLEGATVERNIRTTSDGVVTQGSAAEARMVINRDFDQLKGSFGNVLRGHFPGFPVVPGVIQVKMMAQLATFVVTKARAGVGKSIRPVRVVHLDNFKFSQPLLPGMEVSIVVELLRTEGDIQVFFGKMTYNDSVVSSGEFSVSVGPASSRVHLVQVKEIGKPRPTIVEANEVQRFLPHRDPLLLIDRILHLPESTQITVGEYVEAELTARKDMLMMDRTNFVQGVVPEDIQVEIMAQASAFVLYKRFSEMESAEVKVLLSTVKWAEFFAPVYAEETLIIRSTVKKVRGGLLVFDARIYAKAGYLISAAEFRALGSVEAVQPAPGSTKK